MIKKLNKLELSYLVIIPLLTPLIYSPKFIDKYVLPKDLYFLLFLKLASVDGS